MSTFPPKCQDDAQQPSKDWNASIRDNQHELNGVMMHIVRHVNSELNANQIDLNACEGRIKKHVRSSIKANKDDFARLADSLMETILHGVADVSIAGDSAVRDIEAAIASPPEVADESMEEYIAQSEGDDRNIPQQIIPGLPEQMRLGRPSPATPSPPQNVAVPIQAHEGVTVIRLTDLNGVATATITLNITVLPSPVRIINERTAFAEPQATTDAFGQAPPTGPAEEGSFNPGMFGDTAPEDEENDDPKDYGVAVVDTKL